MGEVIKLLLTNNLACYFEIVFQIRNFQTSVVQRDIDQAARFIGAGAATVGVAGSGEKY